MKKSEKYHMAIVAVLDAYQNDADRDVDKTVETLVELCDTYSTALWCEENGEATNG
ncbi:MAG: hypothetical protein LUG65_03930 [Clostridiales bacterium]|nr:hypothetical protein [Clostridiales bacterium]